MKNTVLFRIRGADFLCIPLRFLVGGKQGYKLCWVKKTNDNFHNLLVEYEVICVVKTIAHAKQCAKRFLEYLSK